MCEILTSKQKERICKLDPDLKYIICDDIKQTVDERLRIVEHFQHSRGDI